MPQGSQKLISRHCSGATLHYHETTGNVCYVSGFQRRSAAGERNRVCGKDRVTCACDVNGLVASIDGYLRQAVARFEECHAIAAARDEQCAQLHFSERCGAAASQFRKILSDRNVVKGFEFRFVRCCRCDARLGVIVQVMACIEGDRRRALLFRKSLADQCGRGDAESIIGNG